MDRKRENGEAVSEIEEPDDGSNRLQGSEVPPREPEKDYRYILDGIGVGYTELDLAGNIIFSNNTALKMATHPQDEVMGMNYKEYMSEEMAKKTYETFHEVYLTGIPKDGFIQEIIKPDGKLKIIEGSISLMKDPGGSITGFRELWRDITDRKRTEEELANHRSHLEAIFGSVKDAIITVDPESRVMEANKSTEKICGMDIREIKGKKFSKCPNQCRKSCYEVLAQTLEKKITIKDYRTECNHQQRYKQLVNVTSSPLLDPAGKFIGAVLVIRDMTLVSEMERELRERHQFENIVGRSRKMQDVYKLLEDLTNLETTVLVTGESGTGKELIARALHYSGQRAFKPFVTVNCSALAENLLESELFGHVKGAFTGAIRDKVGRFQAADGGTIFLDEIGDISSLIQLKLLRVLQEKEFERVGDSVPRKVDVRLISCTNKDLKEKVRRGEFREDLYYRLKVVEVVLPPLRDRLEDLPLLVDHFCQSFNDKFKKNIEGLSSDVLGKFMEYAWPGNVRELEHVMEHAFVLCRGRVITLEHLPWEIRDYERPEKVPLPVNYAKGLNIDREILNALNKTGWNKTEAARLLGITRQTVYRKIYQFSLAKNAQHDA